MLAHPEQMDGIDEIDARLRDMEQMSVWLQGNLRCVTGEDGFFADGFMRKLLSENRYQLLGLDLHSAGCLESRLDGLKLVTTEFGDAMLDQLTQDQPRKSLTYIRRVTERRTWPQTCDLDQFLQSLRHRSQRPKHMMGK